MRRRHREPASNDVAMMAVITKAMGAFMVITLLLLPYYTGDNQSQKAVAETQETIENAKKALHEAADRLKKEHLTSKDIEEVLERLNAAENSWREALAQVNRLKSKLDQYASQINRLEQKNASIEKALDEARKDLSVYDEANVTFVLSWTGCLGADIQLYVRSDLKSKDGQPPPNRTRQQAGFLKTQIVHHRFPRPGDRTGEYVWSELSARKNEKMTIFVKYINAHPFGNQVCTAHLSVGTNISSAALGWSLIIFEEDPYAVIDRIYLDESGEFRIDSINQEEKASLLNDLYASECAFLSCFHKNANPPKNELEEATSEELSELERATSQELFFFSGVPHEIKDEMPNMTVNEMVNEIGALITSRQMTTADAHRRLALLEGPEAEQAEKQVGPTDSEFEKLRKLFKAKDVPPVLAKELEKRVKSGLVSLAWLIDHANALSEIESLEYTEARQKLLQERLPDRYATLLAGLVVRKELSAQRATKWGEFFINKEHAVHDLEGKDAAQLEAKGLPQTLSDEIARMSAGFPIEDAIAVQRSFGGSQSQDRGAGGRNAQ